MAAINFPTATSNGQTFTADTGVIYTYIGTPPNGFWSGTFGTTGLATLDGRFVALNDGNSIQTILTQGLKFNNGSADTILLDGVNGKVGIGTTSPSSYGSAVKLALASSSNTSFTIASGTSGDGTLLFADGTSGDATYRGQVKYAHASDSMLFNTAATERMRIDSSGNVGIGTTSPSEKFVVSNGGNEGFEVVPASASNLNTFYNYNRNTNAYIDSRNLALSHQFWTGSSSSEAMRIDSSGNVGIGTASPTHSLHVKSASAGTAATFESTSGTTYLKLVNSTSSGGYIAYGSTNLGFWTNNSEKMRIDSSGNVGIGTTSPQRALVVSDAGTEGFEFYPGSSAGNNTVNHYNRSTASFVNIITTADQHIFGRADGEKMRIDSSGNVGIGTTPNSDSQLHVKSGANDNNPILRLEGATNNFLNFRQTGSVYDIHVTANDPLSFSIGASERMRIDSSGRMALGTTSPVNIGSGYEGLTINASSAGTLYLQGGGTSGGRLLSDGSHLYIGPVQSSGSIIIQRSHGSYETARFDSSGRLLVGTTSSSSAATIVCQGSSSSATQGSQIFMQRGQAAASISSGDTLGRINFADNAGGVYALIEGGTDGTGGSNDYPGRIVLATTADGASSPTERMRIDSSGRLLVGTTASIPVNGADCSLQVEGTNSPTSRISIINRGNNASGGGIHIAKSRGTAPALVQDDDQVGGIFFCAGDGNDFASQAARIESYIDGAPTGSDTPGRLTFSTTPDQTDTPVERMRIDSSGSVLIGRTSAYGTFEPLVAQGAGTSVFYMNTNNDIPVLTLRCAYADTDGTNQTGKQVSFTDHGGTQVGTITSNGSSTAYNTSSDYRLKENVVNLTAAIPRLKTLPVYRFNFISNADKTVDGFLAHEAQLVVPEAVTGTHNEVDGDGNPVMQSIDQAKLVPLLTAALQEAIGRIETLEIEVAALKAG